MALAAPGAPAAASYTLASASAPQSIWLGCLQNRAAPCTQLAEKNNTFMQTMAQNWVGEYRRLAKYSTTWDYHLWGKYPRSLSDVQVFLPPNSDPSGSIFSKATVFSHRILTRVVQYFARAR
jgi:hypothetical protein